MSDSPLQRLSVPNKLHLGLYAGVSVPAPFQMFTCYECRLVFRPARRICRSILCIM